MEEYFSLLLTSPLFTSMRETELSQLLKCLEAEVVQVPKENYALLAGERPESMGIVLWGALQVIREDDAGNRAVLAALGPGDFYGETLACAGIAESPVSVLAVMPSTVLRLKVRRLFALCPKGCAFHSALIQNLVGIIAGKNLQLQQRMEILDKKTIRERALMYLISQQTKRGAFFTVPYSRSAMADYLAVDRSALSRELSRLRDEGILAFQGNVFKLRQ